jgi:hypothetical protein
MLNMVQNRQLLATPYPRLAACIWERLRSLARSSVGGSACGVEHNPDPSPPLLCWTSDDEEWQIVA